MVREIFSLLGYLVGYVLAMDYYEEFATALQSMVSQEIMARISKFAIVFTVVKIFSRAVYYFYSKSHFRSAWSIDQKKCRGGHLLFPFLIAL